MSSEYISMYSSCIQVLCQDCHEVSDMAFSVFSACKCMACLLRDLSYVIPKFIITTVFVMNC